MLNHLAPFYDAPFGLGVNPRKLVKKVKMSHDRIMSPVGPVKPVRRIDMILPVTVMVDDIINWDENESDSNRGS